MDNHLPPSQYTIFIFIVNFHVSNFNSFFTTFVFSQENHPLHAIVRLVKMTRLYYVQ